MVYECESHRANVQTTIADSMAGVPEATRPMDNSTAAAVGFNIHFRHVQLPKKKRWLERNPEPVGRWFVPLSSRYL